VTGDHALVVEAHKLDHVEDVLLGLDPACAEARLARKDRVIFDPSLLEQSGPNVLWKAEVGDVVAVQVADLPSPDLERELPTPAGSSQHARPGGDLLGDPLARPLPVRHVYLLAIPDKRTKLALPSTTTPTTSFPTSRPEKNAFTLAGVGVDDREECQRWRGVEGTDASRGHPEP
jgi:hypothetical protein